MKTTTTELTVEYIKEHPHIRNCLKKGLINYSALSRLIAKELGLEKKVSVEAILIAARRFRETLKKEAVQERKIRNLLSKSELEAKNKINVYILEKLINIEDVDNIQNIVRKESGTFFFLEGSEKYVIITQDKYSSLITNSLQRWIIKYQKGLVLITIKSPQEIEQIHGVVSFLSSLFAENGINIIEFMSIWTDTILVIESNNLTKAIDILHF